MSQSHAKRSVIISIVSGFAIALTKTIVGVISGSSAMISEAVHSAVDTANSFFLLFGDRAGRRPPDDEHPFGHGREAYFWTLIVAVSIFAGGGAVSIYEGISSLREPGIFAPSKWNYIVLGAALVFEVWPARAAYREFRAASPKDCGLWEGFRRSTDLTTFVVLFENSASVLGIIIAVAGTLTSQLIGNPFPDAIASVLIGALLIVVAVALIRESKGLIVGEGYHPAAVREMRALVSTNSNVEEVLKLLTLNTGPGQVLAVMDLRFRPDLTAARLVDVITDLQTAVHERFPDITRIIIGADWIVPREEGAMSPASV